MLAGACTLHELSPGRRLDIGPELGELAHHCDLLLAEATFVDQVPDHSRGYLSSARQAGQQAADAGRQYNGQTSIAVAGIEVDLP